MSQTDENIKTMINVLKGSGWEEFLIGTCHAVYDTETGTIFYRDPVGNMERHYLRQFLEQNPELKTREFSGIHLEDYPGPKERYRDLRKLLMQEG
ncbi:MAG: hypothetical protein GTN76_14175 [Candidatus Aenigmarchaeota archaeon]|nr:hypothetical protein [Candidatus Aenigmarchaeota archaeon]